MYQCGNLLSYDAEKTCFVCLLDPVWCEEMGHFVCCGEDLERFYVPHLTDHEWKLNFNVKKSKSKKCEVLYPQTIINLATEGLLLYWIESKREFFNC